MRKFYSGAFFLTACLLAGQPLLAKGCNRDIGAEDFCGSYRSTPKTTYVKSASGEIAVFEKFTSVSDLLNQLPSDDTMRNKYNWGLSKAPKKRVSEELHNVELEGFIVAVKPCEDDRDYHVIIKDDAEDEFMNIEVSGLPVDGVDEEDFKRARSEISGVLENANVSEACGNYHKPKNMIHVRIRGSVYFDGDHRAGCPSGCPGPGYAKPSTVWEIHPVYSITELKYPAPAVIGSAR